MGATARRPAYHRYPFSAFGEIMGASLTSPIPHRPPTSVSACLSGEGCLGEKPRSRSVIICFRHRTPRFSCRNVSQCWCRAGSGARGTSNQSRRSLWEKEQVGAETGDPLTSECHAAQFHLLETLGVASRHFFKSDCADWLVYAPATLQC